MDIIFKKTKPSLQNRNSARLVLNKYFINKLNLDKIQTNCPSILSNSQNRKNHNFVLTVKKSPKNIIKEYSVENKNSKNNFEITKYNNKNKNNITPYRNVNNIGTQSTTNSFLSKKSIDNNSYILFKNYLFGNDVLLPFQSLNDLQNSNVPHYTVNNFNKINELSSIKNKKQISIKNELNSLMKKKINKKINSVKLINRKINKSEEKKNLIFRRKEIEQISSFYLNNINTNHINDKLYNGIDKKNYSNKNVNNNFKAKQNYLEKIGTYTQLQEKNKNNRRIKLGNSNYIFNKNSIKKEKKIEPKIYNLINKKEDNNINIYNKIENKKNSLTYNLAKELIDNPNSFVYLLYNNIRSQKYDEEGKPRKLDLKQRFLDYKKDLNKLEQSTRFELFNLKKERAIGNEVNMKGKVISTNSFFNLAVMRGGDF